MGQTSMRSAVHDESATTFSVEVKQPPVRVHGVGLFMDGVGLYMDGVGMVMDPVRATIEESGSKWSKLHDTLATGATGAADAAREAATKLISNHEAVLRDMTQQHPKSQVEVERLGIFEAHFADQALREISRRLLGTHDSSEQLDTSTLGQAKVWAHVADYLETRLQATAHEGRGRAPDMSAHAADAFRSALHEVGAMAKRAME
jgi:hypothetical protein